VVDQNAAPSWVRRAAHYRMLRECRYEDLIRTDFIRLFAFGAGASGRLLDAGCGTGNETVNLRRQAPGLRIYGVDASPAALAIAVTRPETGDAIFYRSTLESLPFSDRGFDYIASHEVIEHVEDPGVVLREFCRVLKPAGVCVIATPNGASLWIEHLRQRAMRLFGRRGAPVGADHTRPPSFWRHEFRRAGFVLDRQIFDGAALEFQLFVAPVRWMPMLSRLFEPLRVVPLVNWLLCDRVKFRLYKPDTGGGLSGEITPCCPACHAGLNEQGSVFVCGNDHRFGRDSAGLIDFTGFAAEPVAVPEAPVDSPPAIPSSATTVGRPLWLRHLRRGALMGLSLFYAGFLLLLTPLALAVGLFHQPFRD
jgi:2-polyprenyl-3-methyl-5-hydroxy-6-metoxy-1,4-benzoquinol methylase